MVEAMAKCTAGMRCSRARSYQGSVHRQPERHTTTPHAKAVKLQGRRPHAGAVHTQAAFHIGTCAAWSMLHGRQPHLDAARASLLGLRGPHAAQAQAHLAALLRFAVLVVVVQSAPVQPGRPCAAGCPPTAVLARLPSCSKVLLAAPPPVASQVGSNVPPTLAAVKGTAGHTAVALGFRASYCTDRHVESSVRVIKQASEHHTGQTGRGEGQCEGSKAGVPGDTLSHLRSVRAHPPHTPPRPARAARSGGLQHPLLPPHALCVLAIPAESTILHLPMQGLQLYRYWSC